jgi:hypothetical protein
MGNEGTYFDPASMIPRRHREAFGRGEGIPLKLADVQNYDPFNGLRRGSLDLTQAAGGNINARKEIAEQMPRLIFEGTHGERIVVPNKRDYVNLWGAPGMYAIVNLAQLLADVEEQRQRALNEQRR